MPCRAFESQFRSAFSTFHSALFTSKKGASPQANHFAWQPGLPLNPKTVAENATCRPDPGLDSVGQLGQQFDRPPTNPLCFGFSIANSVRPGTWSAR